MHNTQTEPVTSSLLTVLVGSKNPVKVGAVENVLTRAVRQGLLPGVTDLVVDGVQVPSGVSDQPVGEEETRQGALGRALTVLDKYSAATWAIGLEGGITRREDGIYTNAWCVIADRHGHHSYGGGLEMLLPAAIVRDLDAGLELGDATDRLFGVKHSKQAAGSLGLLSKNLETRQSAYEGIVVYALVPFLNPDLYELS